MVVVGIIKELIKTAIVREFRMQFTTIRIIWYIPINQVVYHVIANYILMASNMVMEFLPKSNIYGNNNYVNAAQNNEQSQQGPGLDPIQILIHLELL
jgi:hypothetical protein